MIFLSPIWLILAVPLFIFMTLYPHPSRTLNILRGSIFVLILLAMANPVMKLATEMGTVVVIADRSQSMPENSDDTTKEAIEIIEKAKDKQHKLSVVSFGEKVAVEQMPQTEKFSGFVNDVGGGASNLSEAIETAVAMIPPQSPGRILILSDGKWTGKDVLPAAALAVTKDIPIDFRRHDRDSAGDVAIDEFITPQQVSPGESFLMHAWIDAPVSQEIEYKLIRSDKVIAQGKKSLDAGRNRLVFRDQAKTAGVNIYLLEINGEKKDPVLENNRAKAITGVTGEKPVYYITKTPQSGLIRILTNSGIPLAVQTPEKTNWSIENLSRYNAVILENVAAGDIGRVGMKNLAVWVKETGSGLFITGGKSSFGVGGYYKSPLAPILPVTMELRREHRKLALSIAVVLDRSGSMSMPVSGGKTKMDLANLASASVLDLLSSMDEIAAIAVDTQAHEIVRLTEVGNKKQTLRDKILRIQSMGGGIYVYTGLVAASKMLMNAKNTTRHIILFADAADAEEPGKYQDLLKNCESAGITVTAIGLGQDTDPDAGFLRDVAKRGKGRCFFTTDANELPRLFAQDTFVVARNAFIDTRTPLKKTTGLMTISATPFELETAVGGYNLCYVRPEANMAVVSVDEYKAPIVANWQVGLGRVMAYTGEVDGRFTGEISSWQDVGAFFTSLAKWTMGKNIPRTRDYLITQETKNGINRVYLYLNPKRTKQPFDKIPIVRTIHSGRNLDSRAESQQMQWLDADTLQLDVTLKNDGTSLSTVDIPGIGKYTLPPVCLPYSPEFKPQSNIEQKTSLEQVALMSNGKERIQVSEVWKDLPKGESYQEIRHWLILLAALLFLMEVLERRTNLVSSSQKWTQIQRDPQEKDQGKEREKFAKAVPTASSGPVQTKPQQASKKISLQDDSVIGAIQQAKQKAGQRNKK